jgi:hypothetical protein
MLLLNVLLSGHTHGIMLLLNVLLSGHTHGIMLLLNVLQSGHTHGIMLLPNVLLSGHTNIKLYKKCTSCNGVDISLCTTGGNQQFKPWYLKCHHICHECNPHTACHNVISCNTQDSVGIRCCSQSLRSFLIMDSV